MYDLHKCKIKNNVNIISINANNFLVGFIFKNKKLKGLKKLLSIQD